jgi:hypothetical protein
MNNTFTKAAISVGKIIVAIFLIWITYLLLLVKTQGELYVGISLFVFFTLPTIFIVYFKTGFLNKYPKFIKVWKFLRVIYVIIIIFFILAFGFGIYRVYQQSQTDKTIELINSTKITLDDVMGKNLPSEPDKKVNDSTIAGIDANKNYIRDDVELAIFKKYPNSAKIRAAELQYAQALQLELTQVSNSKTLVPVMQKEDYGSLCIGKTAPDVSLKDSREKIIAALAVGENRTKEVETLVLNTDSRIQRQSDIYKKYMTGYASLPGNECDIELSSLPN